MTFNFNGTLEESRKVSDVQIEQMVDEANLGDAFGELAEAMELDENVSFMIGKRELNKCFLFSQMTIINEVMNYEKYYHLRYVEFLEMLCRISLKADLPDDP